MLGLLLKTGILYCVKHSGMSTVHCTVFSFALQLLNFLNKSYVGTVKE